MDKTAPKTPPLGTSSINLLAGRAVHASSRPNIEAEKNVFCDLG